MPSVVLLTTLDETTCMPFAWAQDSSPDTASLADTEVSAASTSISPHHNEQHLEYLMAGIHDMMSSGDKHPAASPRHVAAGAAGGRPSPMPDTLQGLGLSFNAQYYAPGESSTAAIRKAAPRPAPAPPFCCSRGDSAFARPSPTSF
jgi:hypothetical protein